MPYFFSSKTPPSAENALCHILFSHLSMIDLRAFSLANADDSRRCQQKKTWHKKDFWLIIRHLLDHLSMAVVKYADIVPD
jgi:hypothetical protein